MKLAILFWFYKEQEICENRLKLLRKYNPELKIFGLYGGQPSEAGKYQNQLGEYLDDFYTFTASKDEEWKWLNGDLMILDWYEKRGRNLDWDSVAIIQWDTLVLDSLRKQFPDIKNNQIFLSGVRLLDSEVERQWDWTRTDGDERKNYLAYIEYIKKEYNYSDGLLASLFIFQIFPRVYFDKYLSVSDRSIGMLEYKVPTYAKIFKTPFYDKDLGVRWFSDEAKPLNAIPEEIKDDYIMEQLSKDKGWRIFHPYYKIFRKGT